MKASVLNEESKDLSALPNQNGDHFSMVIRCHGDDNIWKAPGKMDETEMLDEAQEMSDMEDDEESGSEYEELSGEESEEGIHSIAYSNWVLDEEGDEEDLEEMNDVQVPAITKAEVIPAKKVLATFYCGNNMIV